MSAPRTGPLAPGSALPEVRLPSHAKEWVSLRDLAGEAPLLVLFFPLAFSSTCTEEMCAVAEDLGSYASLGARVVAVSVDSPYVLARYREACGAAFPFLSDFHREAARAFGVLRPEPLGVGLRDTTDRSAFVVDRAGIVRWSWLSKDPDVLPPFEEIKRVIAGL